jgi:cob(I)alamin adenosyltransferase
MRYLNRLSDYLFVLARLAVVADGMAEDLYTN